MTETCKIPTFGISFVEKKRVAAILLLLKERLTAYIKPLAQKIIG